ncbi:MAG: hypothetical protein HQK66_09555, partial [Desulfamplus sp.]|nr:hypothetical protein [Desulfamplus sp.]
MEHDSTKLLPVFPETTLFTNQCGSLFTMDGIPGPQWQGLIHYLNSLGSKELDRRWHKARQIMHEHGAAYNIFSDQKGTDRQWEPDPIPFPVSTETWELLGRGVAQRMRLLTSIYNDIYG